MIFADSILAALGVLLLEIGLWARVSELCRWDSISPAQAPSPGAVQQQLLKYASRRLGFYAGARYRDVAVACLSGAWEDGSVVESFGSLVGVLEQVGKGLS